MPFLIGTISSNPVQKDTSKGHVVTFRFVTKEGWGDNQVDTWYDASVWNAGLRKNVLAQLASGHKVAIQGRISERTWEDKTYLQISADDIYTTQRLKTSTKAEDQAAAFVAQNAAEPVQPAAAEEIDF